MKFDPTVEVAVDYDGTLTDLEGKLNPVAISCVKDMQRAGAKLILWTCLEGEKLQQALKNLSLVDFVPDRVNSASPNRPQSRKINADFYIDDRATLFGSVDWDGWRSRVLQEIKSR